MTRLPLVALHGFMGSGRTFKVLERLPERVMSPGLPVPASDPDDGLSAAHDRLATQLLEYLEEQKVERFNLLGYSMGGRIALHMVRLAPKRIGKLILESSHPGLESESERRQRCAHDADWAERIRLEWPDVLESWYDQSVFASLSPALRSELIAEKTDKDPVHMARMLKALSTGRQRPMWDDIARWRCPILFVSGEMDDRYRAVGERLAALPGPIRHMTLPGAGHVVHREQPEAYLGALQSFLNQ